MNDKYCVCFLVDEDLFDSRAYEEIEADSAEEAAKAFAEEAFSNGDMWDHSNEWRDEYSVVVISPDGSRSVFNIDVEFYPTFSAWPVKENKEVGQ